MVEILTADDVRAIVRSEVALALNGKSPDTKVWFTKQQSAERLNVSVRTLNRAIAQGRLTAHRINGGHVYRFHRDDLDRYLRGE